jgi:hypothetical protein
VKRSVSIKPTRERAPWQDAQAARRLEGHNQRLCAVVQGGASGGLEALAAGGEVTHRLYRHAVKQLSHRFQLLGSEALKFPIPDLRVRAATETAEILVMVGSDHQDRKAAATIGRELHRELKRGIATPGWLVQDGHSPAWARVSIDIHTA